MGEHFGAKHPQIFGFVDSVEGVDIASPGLEFLEGTYFWEAFPRYAGPSTPAHVRQYRERVGINDSGASVSDPKDVSTASHMFGCWETLFVIKEAVEKSGYKRPGADYKAFIETLEGFQSFPEASSTQGQALCRTDSSGLRPALHLQGGEAPATSRTPDGDRGSMLRLGRL
jgi:branched-chain amino acid transport system substrate-binding protein